MSVIDILSTYRFELLNGLAVTLQLCAIAWVASFVIGGIIGLLAARYREFGWWVRILSVVLAGIPAIVFLFWLHYPAQAVLGIVVPPFVTGAVALSFLGIFMVAEATREVLAQFPLQYITAAKVAGLDRSETFRHIVLPLVGRSFFPSAVFILVTIFQMSLFTSFISVDEIFRTAQRINSIIFRPIEVFTALAIFCVLVCTPLYGFTNILRERYTRDVSER